MVARPVFSFLVNTVSNNRESALNRAMRSCLLCKKKEKGGLFLFRGRTTSQATTSEQTKKAGHVSKKNSSAVTMSWNGYEYHCRTNKMCAKGHYVDISELGTRILTKLSFFLICFRTNLLFSFYHLQIFVFSLLGNLPQRGTIIVFIPTWFCQQSENNFNRIHK